MVIKVEVGLGYCSPKDKCLNLSEKFGPKQNNMVGNHDSKRPNPRYKMNLYQGDNYFKRSFHDKIYIVSMGMNTKFKVDSHFPNAQPFIHFSRSMKL